MLRADWSPYILQPLRPLTTSRDTIHGKLTYFVSVTDTERPGIEGVGEVALFKGLSHEDIPYYEDYLDSWCKDIDSLVSHKDGKYELSDEVSFSSVRFGLETALYDLENGGVRRPFYIPDDWRFEINGLIWMGSLEFMVEQAAQKLAQGFRCLKFKIGGLDFDDEFRMIAAVRERFPKEQLEIRLDANGGFTPGNAMARLERLATLDIHSLEQPIKPRQWDAMSRICRESPIPIALDEELIGMHSDAEKQSLLDTIDPPYIILKPSLCGGFAEADRWIAHAEARNIGWWATSALESDIGLNAIARWLASRSATHPITMPQGLGTGQLYSNNLPAHLRLTPPYLSC